MGHRQRATSEWIQLFPIFSLAEEHRENLHSNDKKIWRDWVSLTHPIRGVEQLRALPIDKQRVGGIQTLPNPLHPFLLESKLLEGVAEERPIQRVKCFTEVELNTHPCLALSSMEVVAELMGEKDGVGDSPAIDECTLIVVNKLGEEWFKPVS